MSYLQTGSVVRMSSCAIVLRSDDGKATARLQYRAPKGEDFLFLCLGTAATSADFIADEALIALLREAGWTVEPPTPAGVA